MDHRDRSFTSLKMMRSRLLAITYRRCAAAQDRYLSTAANGEATVATATGLRWWTPRFRKTALPLRPWLRLAWQASIAHLGSPVASPGARIAEPRTSLDAIVRRSIATT